MPPVNRTEYEQALQAWVQSQMPAGQLCIYEDSDGPDLTAFATIKVIAFPTVGRPEVRVLDQPSGGKFLGQVQMHYRGTCSLNVYGAGARNLLEVIKRSAFIPDVNLANCGAGLFIESYGGTVDLTGLIGDRTRPRFQCDVFFHWSELTEYDGDVIETVTSTGVVQ